MHGLVQLTERWTNDKIETGCLSLSSFYHFPYVSRRHTACAANALDYNGIGLVGCHPSEACSRDKRPARDGERQSTSQTPRHSGQLSRLAQDSFQLQRTGQLPDCLQDRARG